MSVDELARYALAEGFGRATGPPAYQSSDEEETYISSSDEEIISSDEDSGVEDFESCGGVLNPKSAKDGQASPPAAAAMAPALSPVAESLRGDDGPHA